MSDWCCVIIDSGGEGSGFRTAVHFSPPRWPGSRVVSMLDSGAVGPGFKFAASTLSGNSLIDKLFTPIVPVFTKQ